MTMVHQRALLLLEDDPIYTGFQQAQSMHASINRISPDFASSFMNLNMRYGLFLAGLTQLVEFNVVGQKIKPVFGFVLILFVLLCVVSIAIATHCHYKKSPVNHTLWHGLGVSLALLLVLTIVMSIAQTFLNKYSTYNMVFHRIPELVATVNTSTAAATAVLPPHILAFNIQKPGDALKKTLFSGQTIGVNWMKNKEIVTSTKLVDAMKENTNALKKSAYFIAGGTDYAMSDEFMGQLLCLGFISIIGDLGSVVPPPSDRPMWLKAQEDRTVFFDLGRIDFGTHGKGTLWGLCHQMVASNGAFPPCYAWVRTDKEDPCKCTIVAVWVNGKYFHPTDTGWVCAKAMVMIQAFVVIETIHCTMHKMSELNAIAAQYSVPVSDSLYALLEPFTMDVIDAEKVMTTLIITHKIQTLMAFAFITDLDAFKALLPKLLTHMVSHTMESPCRHKYPWWGAYQEKRETIFDTTYAPLMQASAAFTGYTRQLAAQYNIKYQNSAAFALKILKMVSIYHASATFTSARMYLSGLAQLAMGMMQQGATMSTDMWKSWKPLLPTLGEDDFTAWWANALAFAYITGESDGPYLLDPSGYYTPGLSSSEKQALKRGFHQMKALA